MPGTAAVVLCTKYEESKTTCRLWASLLTQARLIKHDKASYSCSKIQCSLLVRDCTKYDYEPFCIKATPFPSQSTLWVWENLNGGEFQSGMTAWFHIGLTFFFLYFSHPTSNMMKNNTVCMYMYSLFLSSRRPIWYGNDCTCSLVWSSFLDTVFCEGFYWNVWFQKISIPLPQKISGNSEGGGGGGVKGSNFRGEGGVHGKLLFQRVMNHVQNVESNVRSIWSKKTYLGSGMLFCNKSQ